MSRIIDRLLGRKRLERTVVYLRTYGITPARFLESEVYYDAWGSPYVHGDAYHAAWMTNELLPEGKTRRDYFQWKHKSGPPVRFPQSDVEDLGWFPKGESR